MGALALRQLDQMLESRALGHAGSSRRRPHSGTETSLQAAILGLQRTAGNQAVASLIGLQRCGPTPCDCNHEDREAARVQRDEADGGDVPVRMGTTCRVFTSFADDFLGTAPRSSFAAMTSFNFVERNGRVAVDEDKAGSWVNKRTVAVNGRPASTTSAVHDCQRGMSRKNATDWTWTPSASCPASADIRSSATANSRDECETVIGAQVDTDDQADMARLLKHEQYHMNLACALASLGNDRIASGAAVAGILRKVIAASRREQRAYDNDTKHGCDSGAQGSWEANIDGGSVKFP
ncbi:MAG: hypothetical protein M3Z28_09915 [Candidatus Dormibacteraeota bacterium]|nr:hypothetical protein [Candidatus Dormibacteraeota bacterium]